MSKDDEVEILERVELSDDEDSGDDFKYEAVEDDMDSDEDDDEDEINAAISQFRTGGGGSATMSSSQAGTKSVGQRSSRDAGVVTQVRPAVVDDFIRDFMNKVGLTKSLESFNSEWYELKATGKISDDYTNPVPDIYLRNYELDEKVNAQREQLEKMREITAMAKGTWDKFRKERDFHRMHHKRVVQEKGKLSKDLKRLHKHYLSYEPTLAELQRKYEAAMKDKMLMRLERDRLRARVATLEQTVKMLEMELRTEEDLPTLKTKAKKKGTAQLPDDGSVVNPFSDLEFEPPAIERYQLRKNFRGHLNSVAALAFHPRKPILASVSDDQTWKLWSVPECDLIMSGEGHKDWISSVAFLPQGTHLLTGSGDKTAKVWDFSQANCSSTFSDHTQAVWGVAPHHTGDFAATCSMDHTTRLWDLETAKCRQTFRGHVDSVNSVVWQPYTNNICTGSGDKTVSLWDARSGLCVQTFYGHLNACAHICMTNRGDSIASCDADGAVKLWDVRMVAEIATIEVCQHPVNQVAFDRAGLRVVTASDDCLIRAYDTKLATTNPAEALICELRGHEDAVQAVVFDQSDTRLVSGSSDSTFRIWN